ncbi:hypothetical protein BGX26_001043 [Mortierella sp. AD094]|nr:hypothetical protein BGX26_001043 [Mortierella sp. AD094]
MTLKKLLHSPNDHLPATIPQLTLTKLQSPLHIPEILCIIFSLANQFTLKNIIRYVCKQWLAVARPFIYNRVLWRLNPYPDPPCDQTFLLDQLHQVAEFRISFEQGIGVDFMQRSLDTILDKVKNLREMNQLRITKLVLHKPNHFKPIVYPLLSSLSTLTDLDLVGVGSGKYKLRISMILALCPKLRSLNMENRQVTANLVAIEDSIPPEYDSIVFQKSGIENLTIRELAVRQDILETVLKKCPQLKTLNLHEIQREWNYPTYDRPSFFTAVAASCPLLQSIHLSILGEHATPEASLAMVQTFVPGIQLPESQHGDKTQYIHRHYHEPSLDTISILEKDITMISAKFIFAPFYDDFFKDTITNLEIVPQKHLPYQSYTSGALHEFLCSAPSLLSLIAPSVPYFAEYLDLSGRTDSEGQYSPKSCAAGRPVSDIRTTKRMWACRGLQTLKIRFTSKSATDDASAENSRIMFGYIVKVCPNLRELSIDRLALNLKPEGGFCLLRQLKLLTRLTILTWTRTDMKKRDIEWIAQCPSAEKNTLSGNSSSKRILKSPLPVVSFLSRLSEVRTNRAIGTSSKLTVKGLENLDSISNVEAYLKEMAQQRRADNYSCWPLLDFLGICLTLERKGEIVNPEHYLPAMISELRPGLEFSSNYSHW